MGEVLTEFAHPLVDRIDGPYACIDTRVDRVVLTESMADALLSIGAAGLIRLIEGATQVMGRNESNQIKDAQRALVQSGGGWANLRGCAVLSA